MEIHLADPAVWDNCRLCITKMGQSRSGLSSLGAGLTSDLDRPIVNDFLKNQFNGHYMITPL